MLYMPCNFHSMHSSLHSVLYRLRDVASSPDRLEKPPTMLTGSAGTSSTPFVFFDDIAQSGWMVMGPHVFPS
jgi:hypothetical protein